MRLQESGQMYLETIYTLSKTHTNVRSIDISEYLGYSKPSVSRAVGILKNGNYILVEKDGQSGVYYLQKGFVFWAPVTLGKTWDETGNVIVESGLEDGMIIVTTPKLVREGENIKY